MEVIKGYLIKTSEGGKRGQIEILTGKVLDNVLLLYPYGSASNMQSDTNSGTMVLVFLPNCSSTNAIGIPYNPDLQPTLDLTEVAYGNFKQGNKITFKANGDVEIITGNNLDITATLADFSGNINVGGSYQVGDTQVVTSQQAAVADATGGGVIDVQARTAINDLLARLRTHGLIAT